MWVQEIEFDISQDPPMCLSEGGIQNAGDISVAELRMAAEQEFGDFFENLVDPSNNDAIIGWKFRTEAKYEDPENGGDFNLETWIILHSEPPEMKFRYYSITDEEQVMLDHISSLIEGVEFTPPQQDDASGSGNSISIDETLSTLGAPTASKKDDEESDS